MNKDIDEGMWSTYKVLSEMVAGKFIIEAKHKLIVRILEYKLFEESGNYLASLFHESVIERLIINIIML